MTGEYSIEEQYNRTFAPGTILFTEGDEGTELFVIRKGSVQISRKIANKEYIIAVIPEGSFFGEMSLLLNRPRSATATVLEPAQIMVFDQQTFLRMVAGQSNIAISIMKNLAHRLYRANIQIETLLLGDKTHRVVKALNYLSIEEGEQRPDGIFVPTSLKRLSAFVGFPLGQVAAIIDKLAEALLVLPQRDGFLIAEQGRYIEFLEFLDMKEKFGG
ncbi:Crp/Fnr family transcriptional regulator [Myxococcota bacterium]|nr:Crp/Fnr family transcriptional regulator [Myxococcota bacterium]MBU1537788.1 Crp/Fnr family transcriptional regulator [Myxococcota bacterium]